MNRLTYAIVAAGASLAAGTTTASTGDGSPPPSEGGPVCNGAASQGAIWPPDHRMVSETIVGMDPTLTIVVTKIQQDEPVETLGSGNTEPDGSGLNSPTAQVRAERSGLGTGRIYVIWYTATDIYGRSCTGSVQVQVPHDQGQGVTPVDTLQRYDSTLLFD